MPHNQPTKNQPIGTAIIVQNKNGEILLGKRINSFGEGFYGIPGGRVERGEKLASCADRELKEETGLKSKEFRYLCVVKEWQESKNQDFIHFIFLCNDFDGTPVLLEPEKCESWNWYDLNNLPENILPGHLVGIEVLKSGDKVSLRDI